MVGENEVRRDEKWFIKERWENEFSEKWIKERWKMNQGEMGKWIVRLISLFLFIDAVWDLKFIRFYYRYIYILFYYCINGKTFTITSADDRMSTMHVPVQLMRLTLRSISVDNKMGTAWVWHLPNELNHWIYYDTRFG